MTNPMQVLLFVALPYAAIVLFVAGLVWAARGRYAVSARSSQMLEGRLLPWGSIPFHFGIAVIVVGHILPLVAPDLWQAFVSNRVALLSVEAVGAAAAILCLFGLAVLLVRRIASAPVRQASQFFDVIVLLVLIAEVGLGFSMATMHRWGAVWSVRTTTPWLWSIFTLQPDPSFVAGAPLLLKLHLIGAWVTLALVPFTRLAHMFALPLHYLWRRPQKVVWATRRTTVKV